METNELILNHVIEIKENVAGMNQHLKDINGSVQRHSKQIIENRENLFKTNKKLAYYSGGLVVLTFIITWFLKYS